MWPMYLQLHAELCVNMCVYACIHASEAHNADGASRMASLNAATMSLHDPWQSTLVQLGLASGSSSDKETVFLNNVRALGFTLQTKVQMKQVQFPAKVGLCQQPVLPVKELAEEILRDYPEILFCGHGYDQLEKVQATFSTFWERFRHTWPKHPVFEVHHNDLHRCIPCRIHSDEGTSFRKAGIFQQSWGPVIKSGPASWRHCFFYTCLLAQHYKACPELRLMWSKNIFVHTHPKQTNIDMHICRRIYTYMYLYKLVKTILILY